MRFFRALQARDYRRYFTGQAISLVGDWMTITTTGWLAYDLTHDPRVLGLVVFMQQIPLLFVSPVAGALGDRVNRRKLFCVLQSLCMLHAGTLALLTLSHNLTPRLLVGLALCRGLVNAVEFPTRQSLMIDLVGDRTNLPNAIALNATLFNVARLIGPSLAGLAIAGVGPGWCYATDCFSGIPVILLMLSISDAGAARVRKDPVRPFAAIREGARYAKADMRLFASLVLIGAISFAGFAHVVLAPMTARDLLHGDARTLGYIHTAVGLGAFTSAIALGLRHTHEGLEKWVRSGILLVAAGQTIVAVSSHVPATLAGMSVCGVGAALVYAGSNTLMQAHVDDDKRGRVMGLFAMSQGLYPIGGLVIGFLAATAMGPRITMLLTALCCLVAAVWYRRNAKPGVPATAAAI